MCPASLAKVFYETKAKINKTESLLNKLARNSKMVAANSSAAEKRAKKILADVKVYVKSIEGKIVVVVLVIVISACLVIALNFLILEVQVKRVEHSIKKQKKQIFR